jgi:hypothetical protein
VDPVKPDPPIPDDFPIFDPTVPKPPMIIAPATVKNSPVPGFFDPTFQTPMGESFRSQFVFNEMQDLAAPDLKDIRMRTIHVFNAGESSLEGAAGTNYLSLAFSAGDTSFLDAIDSALEQSPFGKDCPPDDPLNAEAILSRASSPQLVPGIARGS